MSVLPYGKTLSQIKVGGLYSYNGAVAKAIFIDEKAQTSGSVPDLRVGDIILFIKHWRQQGLYGFIRGDSLIWVRFEWNAFFLVINEREIQALL